MEKGEVKVDLYWLTVKWLKKLMSWWRWLWTSRWWYKKKKRRVTAPRLSPVCPEGAQGVCDPWCGDGRLPHLLATILYLVIPTIYDTRTLSHHSLPDLTLSCHSLSYDNLPYHPCRYLTVTMCGEVCQKACPESLVVLLFWIGETPSSLIMCSLSVMSDLM